jgi:hypothetical protein
MRTVRLSVERLVPLEVADADGTMEAVAALEFIAWLFASRCWGLA